MILLSGLEESQNVAVGPKNAQIGQSGPGTIRVVRSRITIQRWTLQRWCRTVSPVDFKHFSGKDRAMHVKSWFSTCLDDL